LLPSRISVSPPSEQSIGKKRKRKKGKMKVLTTWAVRPGAHREAVSRFLPGGGLPPEGVTLLGRWHKVDLSGGYSLYETSDPVALFASAAVWAEVLEIHSSVVVEDGDAAPLLAKVFAS
jgi:Protein of unknown function (DUF3303)